MTDMTMFVANLLGQVSERDPATIGPRLRLTEDLGVTFTNRLELGVLLGEAVGRELPRDALIRARTVADLVALADPDPVPRP